MILIAVGKGLFAEVDDVDWDLSFYSWFLHDGYVEARLNGKNTRLHNIIANRMGLLQSQHIDHEDQNKLNNKRSNLREATSSQNQANRVEQVNNRLGFKGICFHQGKYQVSITKEKRQIYLGRFDTIEQAHLAYSEASKRYFGEFSSTEEL